jgi:hypothetical protein
MYAIVYTADEEPSYIGAISETFYAGRPMVQIDCPATRRQLAHTVLVDARCVRAIRFCPEARLAQALAEWHSAYHCGGDEAELFHIVTGRYPWVAGADKEEDADEYQARVAAQEQRAAVGVGAARQN